MATSNESRLLALPLELLTRIADCLNDESLPSLRLTCKTLEGPTFDRFARKFSHVQCCMFYEERWLSVKSLLNGSPRLAQKIHTIEFLTRPLESTHVDHVQLAPGAQFQDIEAAQSQFDSHCADEDYPYEPLHAGRQPRPALIHGVLLDTMYLAPHVVLEFNFSEDTFFRRAGVTVHEDVLLAITSTGCRSHALTLSPHTCDDLNNVATYLRPRLLWSISNLQTFTFDGNNFLDDVQETDFDWGRLDLAHDILQNANSLIDIELRCGDFIEFSDPTAITDKLLFTNCLPQLVRLSLHLTVLSEQQLLRALAICSSRLVSLSLGRVQFKASGDSWIPVFRQLTTLPKLAILALFEIRTSGMLATDSSWRLDFEHIGHGKKLRHCPTTAVGVHFEGRNDVTAGLQELLAGPLRTTRCSL